MQSTMNHENAVYWVSGVVGLMTVVGTTLVGKILWEKWREADDFVRKEVCDHCQKTQSLANDSIKREIHDFAVRYDENRKHDRESAEQRLRSLHKRLDNKRMMIERLEEKLDALLDRVQEQKETTR